MSKKTAIILDTGHGGWDVDGYRTPGKRSPEWVWGTIYEGVSNRALCFDIGYWLSLKQWPHVIIHPTATDTPLGDRVRTANKISSEYGGNTLFVSIHSNAGGGTGFEAFISEGSKVSGEYATAFCKMWSANYPDKPLRKGSGGELFKRKNYRVLVDTKMPAVLLEVLFMDNIKDYMSLTNPEYRAKLAKDIADVMMTFEK